MPRFHGRYFLAGLAVLALWSPAAGAATLPLTLEQLTDASDYVVRGTVSQLWVERDARGNLWTRVELEVADVVKGPADLDALRLDVMGGFLGNEVAISLDSPRFDEGEDVLVFAERLESGLLVPTALERGKFTVRIDPASGREMLVQFNPAPERPYDHRFIPDPPVAERAMLADVLARVEARVEEGWDGRPIPGKSPDRLHAMYPAVEVSR